MKYKLSNEILNHNGRVLYRVQALQNFNDVKAGDLGGWVESEQNLSQEGESWIFDEAKVYGNAKVLQNARVYNNVEVFDNARVYDTAAIYENAKICGYAGVYDDCTVYGNAEVYDEAGISGEAAVFGNAKVFGSATVNGNAHISGDARISGDAEIYGDAVVSGNAHVYDKVKVNGNAHLRGDAYIGDEDDYCVFNNFGSVNRSTTFYKTKYNEIYVKCGCFDGNLKEFKKQVKKRYNDNKFAKEYLLMIKLVKVKFELD